MSGKQFRTPCLPNGCVTLTLRQLLLLLQILLLFFSLISMQMVGIAAVVVLCVLVMFTGGAVCECFLVTTMLPKWNSILALHELLWFSRRCDFVRILQFSISSIHIQSAMIIFYARSRVKNSLECIKKLFTIRKRVGRRKFECAAWILCGNLQKGRSNCDNSLAICLHFVILFVELGLDARRRLSPQLNLQRTKK